MGVKCFERVSKSSRAGETIRVSLMIYKDGVIALTFSSGKMCRSARVFRSTSTSYVSIWPAKTLAHALPSPQCREEYLQLGSQDQERPSDSYLRPYIQSLVDRGSIQIV